MKHWDAWNESLSRGQNLPPGMSDRDRIYVNCGNYHLGDNEVPNPFEQQSIENLTKAGMGHTQYLLGEQDEVARAKADGFDYAVDPFNLSKEGTYQGYFDAVGGVVYADKACRYALHLAQSLGVKFILDQKSGNFERLHERNGKAVGIVTADGKTHNAELTILALGGWTPSAIPEMDGLCETTAGSIAMLQLPRGSPLTQKFSPERFPVWHYKTRGGADGNLYGFPVDERGIMKLGYRGTKYTNPSIQPNNKVRSVPITKWTSPSITGLPEKSTQVIRGFLDTHMPELRQNGIDITSTRLCWYTDSFDNHFVVDAVPSRRGVMVATGGSGHAFKFLPVLGKFVADRIEAIESDMLKRWEWRQIENADTPYNKLMAGSEDENALQNVRMSERESY